MDLSKIKLPKGINIRSPYQSELDYFKKNPHVGGMATEDNKVILNPYSPLSEKELQSVAINESSRLLMRQMKDDPNFELTPSQKAFLDTTTYKDAPERERKSTIAARIVSGDPSAGEPTKQQLDFAEELKRALGIGEY